MTKKKVSRMKRKTMPTPTISFIVRSITRFYVGECVIIIISFNSNSDVPHVE